MKELKAKDEASAKAFEAKGKLDDFNNTKMATKNLEASGNASPFTDEAQDKLNILIRLEFLQKYYQQPEMLHLLLV